MNERQCEWGEGWDAAQAHFEKRLDTMAEEYEALLKSASRDAAVQDVQIEQLRIEQEILHHEIEQLKRELLARRAERDFAEKQLDKIRRALA